MKKVTIIGGGTGTYVVTRILKAYDYDLTKIVVVFDSGGSTGRLRDEFGFLPVGDLRQSLAALAKENGQDWISNLLLYRFSKGDGLEGHNLGNLILLALQDMTEGSTPKALEIATKVFRLKGNIYPVTTGNSHLKTIYQDGSSVVGEEELDDPKNGGKKIEKIELTEKCHIYSKARQAIEESEYVIIGPGDLYASILPNFIVSGVKPAIARSKAKFVYITNLMTRHTQTHGYTATDHARAIEKYIGRPLDYILVNNGTIAPKMAKTYAKYQEFPVINDLTSSKQTKVISQDFASSIRVKKQPGDSVPRSLMRHDQEKLSQALAKILK